MIVNWQFDPVNTKEIVLPVCDKPYHTNKKKSTERKGDKKFCGPVHLERRLLTIAPEPSIILKSFRKSFTFGSRVWVSRNIFCVMFGFPVLFSKKSPCMFSLFTSQCWTLKIKAIVNESKIGLGLYKNRKVKRVNGNVSSGSVVERSPRKREAVGSILDRVILKAL